MCEAHWPFKACSYGGVCDETLQQCSCREEFTLAHALFQDGADCVVPNWTLRFVVNFGFAMAVLNIFMRAMTLVRKNYFARLKHVANREQAIRYRRCMMVAVIEDIALLTIFATYVSKGIENVVYTENIPLVVTMQVSSITFWVHVIEHTFIAAENAASLDALHSDKIFMAIARVQKHGWPLISTIVIFMAIATPLAVVYGKRWTWIYVYFPGTIFLIFLTMWTGRYVLCEMQKTIQSQLEGSMLPSTSQSALENLLSRLNGVFLATRFVGLQSLSLTLPVILWPWLWSWSSLYVAVLLMNGTLVNLALQRAAPSISLRTRRKKRNQRQNGLTLMSSRKVDSESATTTANGTVLGDPK